MKAQVIDTNVMLVANGKAEQASLKCMSLCIDALETARRRVTVIDDAFYLFGEYTKEVSSSGQPGVGDAFLLWLLQNRGNADCCEIVALKPNGSSFEEFSNDPALADFDLSDHKFAAAAKASVNAPDILNAVDSDWWIHERVLQQNELKVVHLCEEQVSMWETTKTQK